MKPLVIYHDNCADGFGAAFAAWLKLGDGAEYLPQQYNSKDFAHPFDIIENVDGRDVYILDFSFPKPVMETMIGAANFVVWLDHHKTSREYAEEKCGGYIGARTERHAERYDIVHDNDKSGAVLAWEYFHPNTEIPMLIRHVDDYDRWQFKIDGTKAFNKALWGRAPWGFREWDRDFIIHFMSGQLGFFDLDDYYAEGAVLLRAHEQNVQSVVKGAARPCAVWVGEYDQGAANDTENEPYQRRGLAANCPPHLTSDVGHELATQSGTFGLCWCLGKKEGLIAQCSLRSNGDYDVSAIAKAFGGGGHKNAAGFEVPIDILLGWMK